MLASRRLRRERCDPSQSQANAGSERAIADDGHPLHPSRVRAIVERRVMLHGGTEIGGVRMSGDIADEQLAELRRAVGVNGATVIVR